MEPTRVLLDVPVFLFTDDELRALRERAKAHGEWELARKIALLLARRALAQRNITGEKSQ